MRISIFVTLSILLILPCFVYGQADGTDSLQGDNGNSNGELDLKNDDPSLNDNENQEAKPRKTTFKEERFEKLFNNRLRKPRLTAPKYHQKPKAKLPSFIKSPPVIKPLGQDGLPVDDVVPQRPTAASTRAKPQTNNARATVSKATTSAPRTRSRASTTTTTAKPSLNDSNKRFSSSARGRIPNSSNSIPSIGRARLN